jgi:hypothetical protein
MKTQQHQNANIGAGSILQAVASDAKTKVSKINNHNRQVLLSVANSYQSFYGLEIQESMRKNSWVVKRSMLYL